MAVSNLTMQKLALEWYEYQRASLELLLLLLGDAFKL